MNMMMMLFNKERSSKSGTVMSKEKKKLLPVMYYSKYDTYVSYGTELRSTTAVKNCLVDQLEKLSLLLV